MSDLFEILIPFGICVILPIGIVWIIFHAKTNRDNKNAEVLIKAIESKSVSDVDQLMENLSMSKKKMGNDQVEKGGILERRLLIGTGFTLAGIATGIATWIYYSLCKSNFDNGGFLLLLLACIGLSIGIANLTVFFIYRNTSKQTTE